MRPRPLARRRSQPRAQRGVVDQPLQRRAEAGAIAQSHQERGAFVRVDLTHRQQIVRQRRQARAHRFQHAQRAPFAQRGLRVDVECGQQPRRIHDQAGEVHVGVPVSGTAQVRLHRSCADQVQVHVGAIGEFVEESLQQPVGPLDLAQPTDVADRHRARRQVQLGPRRFALRRGGLRRRNRNAVGDHRHPRATGGPAENVLPHFLAARDQRIGRAGGQRRRLPLLALRRALLVEGGHHPRFRTQRARGDRIQPGAEVVRVQHGRAALLQIPPDAEQRLQAHAVGREQLDVDSRGVRQHAHS